MVAIKIIEDIKFSQMWIDTHNKMNKIERCHKNKNDLLMHYNAFVSFISSRSNLRSHKNCSLKSNTLFQCDCESKVFLRCNNKTEYCWWVVLLI